MYNPFKTVFYERRKLLLLIPDFILVSVALQLIQPDNFMNFLDFFFVTLLIVMVTSYMYDVAVGAHNANPPQGFFKGHRTQDE